MLYWFVLAAVVVISVIDEEKYIYMLTYLLPYKTATTTSSSPRSTISKRRWRKRDWVIRLCIWIVRIGMISRLEIGELSKGLEMEISHVKRIGKLEGGGCMYGRSFGWM